MSSVLARCLTNPKVISLYKLKHTFYETMENLGEIFKKVNSEPFIYFEAKIYDQSNQLWNLYSLRYKSYGNDCPRILRYPFIYGSITHDHKFQSDDVAKCFQVREFFIAIHCFNKYDIWYLTIFYFILYLYNILYLNSILYLTFILFRILERYSVPQFVSKTVLNSRLYLILEYV